MSATSLKTMLGATALALFVGAAGAQEPDLFYSGGMTIQPERGVVALDWRIAVTGEARESVTFMLNPAFENVEIGGAHVRAVSVDEVEGFAGPIATYTLDLAPPATGERQDITIRYGGELLPNGINNNINAVSPNKVELTVDSFWMPVDQSFSSLLAADLDIAIAGDWAGVAVDEITARPGGFSLQQRRPSLDIAFTLMSRYERHETEQYVIYDLRPSTNGAGVEAVTGALEHCTAYLNGLAGAGGPLPQAAVTVNARESSGYSRATLIALTDIADTPPENLTQFICHELGHYWSRGNAMTVENWINESFADYLGMMGLRAAHGEAAFETRLDRYRVAVSEGGDLPPVWTPQTTQRPPYLVAYRKGPLALAALEAEIGRAAFARFMTRQMEDLIATTPDLLNALEAEAGREARLFFEARLAE